jgi:hypothetical protein
MKARFVTGGNFLDVSSVGETNAPTVNPFTVFFMLNEAAEYGVELLTVDIKEAYLIPDIVHGSGPDTYIWIEKKLTEIFVKLYLELKQYVCPNGKLIFKLLKYLRVTVGQKRRWIFTNIYPTQCDNLASYN